MSTDPSVRNQRFPRIIPYTSLPQNGIMESMQRDRKNWKVFENLFRINKLTDVRLIAGDKTILAHRLILGASSDYFAIRFENPMSISTPEEFVFMDIDGDTLSTLVECCYTGSIELQGKNIKSLLKAAHQLQLIAVVGECCQVLRGQLNPGNCLGLKIFADSLGRIELSNAAHTYALEHFTDVIKNREFLCLSCEELAEFLESYEPFVSSVETVFHALVKWIEDDYRNRSKYASKLISSIKLSALSPAFIAEYIEGNELFRSQKAVQDLVVKTLLFHLLSGNIAPAIQSDGVQRRKAFEVDVLLAIGKRSVDAYFAEDNVWRNVTSTSDNRTSFSSSIFKNQLLVIGGRINGRATNTVKSFNFSNRSWNTLPPMNTPRHSCGAAVLGGLLYVVGGNDGSKSLASVERWDPVNQRWSNVAPMPTQRHGVNVTVLNNELYAVGGVNDTFLSTLECYDPHRDEWTTRAPMLTPRSQTAGVANEYIYILGGFNGTYLDVVERYDPRTNTWSTQAPMSVRKALFGAGMLNNRLFTVVGHDGSESMNLVEAYNPQRNTWQEFAPLQVADERTCEVVKKSILNIE